MRTPPNSFVFLCLQPKRFRGSLQFVASHHFVFNLWMKDDSKIILFFYFFLFFRLMEEGDKRFILCTFIVLNLVCFTITKLVDYYPTWEESRLIEDKALKEYLFKYGWQGMEHLWIDYTSEDDPQILNRIDDIRYWRRKRQEKEEAEKRSKKKHKLLYGIVFPFRI